jgi:hypothetical protein
MYDAGLAIRKPPTPVISDSPAISAVITTGRPLVPDLPIMMSSFALYFPCASTIVSPGIASSIARAKSDIVETRMLLPAASSPTVNAALKQSTQIATQILFTGKSFKLSLATIIVDLLFSYPLLLKASGV